MRRVAIVSLLLAVFGIGGWVLWREFRSNVETIVATRREPAPREVAQTWPFDRFSPGHSEHVLNRGLECNDCHDPDRADFGGVDMGVCTGCHEPQAAIAHMGGEDDPTTCFDCHAFKADGVADGPWDCVRCHGPFDAQTHEGLAMHDSVACATCHHPHEPIQTTVATCTECHTGIRLRHGNTEVSGTCTDCHGGHQLAIDAKACMSCHADHSPTVPSTATFDGGHASCASCHQAHSFSKSTAAACATCHEDTTVLAARSVPEHRDCGACHDAHAVRRADDRTCTNCHAGVRSSHPDTDGKACIACHDPHPKRMEQLALRCSHCHEEASTEHAYHAGRAACTDCHAPHGFDLSSVVEVDLCVRCHSAEVRLTRHVAGHQPCTSCHQGNAHHIGDTLECEGCHTPIVASSPAGHQDCTSCHDPHRARIASAQDCTSCHALSDLPGLHRLPVSDDNLGHSECTACHDVHALRARADRETCMACHEGIASHEPDAKRCTGCHTFIRGSR